MRGAFDKRPIKATVFRAAADERWKDARCLHRAGRYLGAIYLCGYAVECELKAGVCSLRRVGGLKESEAKSLGHRLFLLLDAAGVRKPLTGNRDLYVAFQNINDRSSTEMRYSGRGGSKGQSQRFLDDSRDLVAWLRTASRA